MIGHEQDIAKTSLAQLLERATHNALRSQINTVMPGIVTAYSDGRCSVQPVFDMVFDDDSRTVCRPQLADIPVVMLHGGGYGVFVPVSAGDQGVLLFAQRDLTGWKQTSSTGAPPSRRIFSLPDALFVPGLLAPASPVSDRLVLHHKDGGTRIEMSPSEVSIRATTVRVEGNLRVTGSASGSGPWSPPNP